MKKKTLNATNYILLTNLLNFCRGVVPVIIEANVKAVSAK